MALPADRDWIELDALLCRVLALPPSQRDTRLERMCDGNRRRVAQLRRLLAFAEAAPIDDLLQSPLLLDALTRLQGVGTGNRLGDWQLGRRLATGGMSEIFDAERVSGEVRQRAAIKLLAIGGEMSSLPARFARECRILATLSDARIARYYDSGVAADGRPWLAMEIVDGVPLDRYVDTHRLDLRRRVALFIDLLGAVGHAHRHLIVHRDLKPANILVTAEGQLKLIDFGIARALDEAKPSTTAVESRLLTLDYASPEQLRGGVVTVASDVYQLGLVLYELVVGRHPFADSAKDRLALIRAVLERAPDAPSRVLRGMGDAAGAAMVRGDFDAIALKVAAKDPVDRYAGVDAFAADLVAWLDSRPVLARKTGAAGRVARFLRRHRIASAGAAIGMAIVIALSSAWLTQVLRANDAARSSEAVLALLEQTLHANRYGQQPQPPETVAELLDQTERRAHAALADEPDVLARTLLLVGNARLGRGEYRRAASVLEGAHLAASQGQSDERLLAGIARPLTTALHYSGDVTRALRWSDRMLAQARSPIEMLAVLNPRADLLHSRGDYRAAAEAAKRAIHLSRQTYGDDSPYAHQVLATALRDMGEFAQARIHLDRALRIERALGPPAGVGLAVVLDGMGQLHLQAGDLHAAGTVLREAKSIRDRLFQPGYLSRAWVDHRIALLALAEGDDDRAVAGLTAMVALYARDLGERSHITASARSDLGWALLAGGDPAAAREQFARAEDVFSGWVDGRHPRRAEALLGQAVLAQMAGDRDRAGDLALAALAIRRRDTHERHPMLAAICQVARAAERDCRIPPASPTALASRQLALAASAGPFVVPAGAAVSVTRDQAR